MVLKWVCFEDLVLGRLVQDERDVQVSGGCCRASFLFWKKTADRARNDLCFEDLVLGRLVQDERDVQVSGGCCRASLIYRKLQTKHVFDMGLV
jgi:hypothetical protein